MYTNASPNGRNATRRSGESRDLEAQIRLQKLEEMVTVLMRTTKDSPEHHDEESSTQTGTFDQRLKGLSIHNASQILKTPPGGHLDVTHDSETNYLGATHWEAILENVSNFS